MIKLKAINLESLCCYVLAVMIIASTRSMWIYRVDSIISYEQLVILADLFMLAAFFAISAARKSLIVKASTISIITLILAVIYTPLAQTNHLVYVALFLFTLFCSILFLCSLDEKKRLWYSIENIMLVLSVLSLLFYVGGTVLNIIPSSGTTTFEWAYTRTCDNYYNLYYEAQKLNMGSGFFVTRNCGIFTEAPMFSFLLGTALAVDIFLRNNMSKWKCFIYIITIITTRSTAGILTVLLCAFLYYACIASRSKKHDIRRGVLVVIGFLAVGISIFVLGDKLEQDSGSTSVGVRSDHIIACLKAWINSPLIGQGYLNQDAVMEYESYQQGISIGWLYMLATGGILLFSTLLIPFVANVVKHVKRKQYEQFSFEFVVFFLFFFTAISGTPIIVFYIAYLANGTSVRARENVKSIKERKDIRALKNTVSAAKRTAVVRGRKRRFHF